MPLRPVMHWFLAHQRDLPWRYDRTPYRVWISEVMLQQTRASVVISYYKRWMERFPTIESLAKSELAEVIKLWEGLGYYSRARNLHGGAQDILERFNGEIPSSYEELLSIKGLGPYTASAILAFGFQKKAAAVDGNVARVLARWLGFSKDVTKHAKELRAILEDLLPEKDAPILMEGLIELGALVCQKKAACSLCPLQESCTAHREGKTDLFPIKPVRKKIIDLYRFVPCIMYEDFFLLQKREKGEIMADLWEFPYVEMSSSMVDFKEMHQKVEKMWGLSLVERERFGIQKGHFTHYRAHFYPAHYEIAHKKELPGFHWVSKEELKKLPFSSAHRKIAHLFLK